MAICDDYLTAIDEGYDGAKYWQEVVSDYRDWFNDNPAHSFNAEWRQMLRGLFNAISWTLKCLVYADGDLELPLKIPYYLRHCVGGEAPEPYELTMDKILEAMWDTDKLRNFHFINYIDAMRASIWNTEIYETHLAEWYRHFSL